MGAYAVAFVLLVVLSGLIFLLYRHGQMEQHSTSEGLNKGGIGKSGRILTEIESLKVKGAPGVASLVPEEPSPSQDADKSSDSSARRERSSASEEISPPKGPSAPSAKTETRKAVRLRTSVGPAPQAITDALREERGSSVKENDLDDRGKSASENRSEVMSQTPGSMTGPSTRETSGQDKEEVESGRVIDWLLEKRTDRK
jgi:hypothetical protein